MSDDFIGVVGGVYALDLGDKLSQAALAFDTVLHVYDVADFDDQGGYLRINGDVISYATIDDDASTITLNSGLASAAGVDTVVEVWDNANGTNATIYKAVIDQLDGFDGQPVEAVIDQSIAHALADTMRGNQTGESVSLERIDGELRVTTVHGRAFSLASQQILQGGMTTRDAEDAAGIDIVGTDTAAPGVAVYGPNGLLQLLISADVAGGIEQFWTGDSTETGPAWVNPGMHTGSGVVPTPALELASPQTSAGRSRIDMFPDQIYLDTAAFINASLTVKNNITTNNGDVNASNGNVSAFGTVTTVNPNTTTNAANARINNTGGGDIRLVTSLSKHKLEQQELTVDDARGLLEVPGKTWFDRAEVEENNGSTDGLRRIPGLVAEDVERHAPALALYDEDGELQGVAYDRVAALLIPIVRDQQQRIERLETLVADLLGKDTA